MNNWPWNVKSASREKVEAFFFEFPFLSQYAKASEIEAVEVRRWDSTLLSWYPWRGSEGSWASTIRLLDAASNTVAIVGEYGRKWWKPWTWLRRQEAAFDTFYKMGEDAAKVTMIVIIHKFYTDWRIMVYKPAHGFKDLKSWFDTQRH